MKKLQYMFSYRSIGLLLAILLLSGGGDLFAQKKKSKKKTNYWNVEFSLASTYDDNILKYSDKYLDRFMNNEDEGRFHIDTYDDIIINPSMKVSYSKKIFGKRKSKFDALFSPKKYVNNDVKSWSSLSIGYRQYLTRKASFKLSYDHIPEFYVRHFRDDDWTEVYGYTPITFQPYSFSKNSYSFSIQNTFLKNTKLSYAITYIQYFHNEHFTEYDCINLVHAFNLTQPLSKKVKVVLGYYFTNSDAKGYDESFETKINTDDSDASYAEDRFNVAINWSLPRVLKKRHSLNIEGRLINRYFSSPHFLENDPIHAGRVDDNINFFVSYSLTISKQLKLSVYNKFLYRDSYTLAEPNKSYVSDEKDYRQNQTGFKLSYSFSL